jgi:hypothetical protein
LRGPSVSSFFLFQTFLMLFYFPFYFLFPKILSVLFSSSMAAACSGRRTARRAARPEFSDGGFQPPRRSQRRPVAGHFRHAPDLVTAGGSSTGLLGGSPRQPARRAGEAAAAGEEQGRPRRLARSRRGCGSRRGAGEAAAAGEGRWRRRAVQVGRRQKRTVLGKPPTAGGMQGRSAGAACYAE